LRVVQAEVLAINDLCFDDADHHSAKFVSPTIMMKSSTLLGGAQYVLSISLYNACNNLFRVNKVQKTEIDRSDLYE